jgi:cell division protein FtsI/penicillin-binding protein 2
MKPTSFRSASGLRPASAFLFVAVVLGLVVGKAIGYGALEEHTQPSHVSIHEPPRPDFDLVDRDGRVMAQSVERMDLVMSPRATWQAHTPDRIADKLSVALGPDCDRDALLATMLPDSYSGVLLARGELFQLDQRQAQRVHDWYTSSDIDGFQVVAPASSDHWELLWDPAHALGEAVRERHAGEMGPPSPTTWSRYLADGLARAVLPEEQLADSSDDKALRKQRDLVWRGLMRSADAVAFEGIDPTRVDDVIAVLDEEKVAAHQMRVDFQHARAYPVRDESSEQDPFEILGEWRFVDMERAREMTALHWAEVVHDGDSEHERIAFEREVRQALDHRHPFCGLERLGAHLFEQEPWRQLRPLPAHYEYDRLQPARGQGKRYYQSDCLEGETPKVVTTIDARLQSFTRQVLLEVVEEHEPAVTMAIVVDVESGEVLAVDGVSNTVSAEFLPLYHEYTPGSTFKVLVMAAALEADAVYPEEIFDTHNGTYWFEGRRSPIREAEGHQTGLLSARYGLAHSVNAILVQIGTRVPAEFLHEKLEQLGYGAVPAVGLGRERDGHLTDLPWKKPYTHVSVCFGHEVGVTLWQHAAGLATVLRGGESRPLSLVRGIGLNGNLYTLDTKPDRRVFREETCEQVREMMRLGALEGTGESLQETVEKSGSPIWFGSKTGTTEKETGVVCLHLEQERNEQNRGKQSSDSDFVSFASLKSKARPHDRACYVSSICVFGRVPGDDREVMVYLVADEALKNGKYGSRIAGPAAMKLLHEALGLTLNGVPTWVARERNGEAEYAAWQNTYERPWNDRSAPIEAAWEGESGE